MNPKNAKTLYRIGIILILLIVVAVIIVLKSSSNDKKKIEKVAAKKEAIEDSLTLLSQPKELITAESLSNTAKPIDSIKQKEDVKREEITAEPSLAKDELAIVNNTKITQKKFDSIFNTLPAQIKEVFKDDKVGFLEELIT
ncbi:MAG: hypothetical protein ABIJ94_04640, partial [candidate division WOR-3 bacterium]